MIKEKIRFKIGNLDGSIWVQSSLYPDRVYVALKMKQFSSTVAEGTNFRTKEDALKWIERYLKEMGAVRK